MGYARKRNYREGDMGMYHCTVRCVRKSFLLGKDLTNMVSYDHRREWVRCRLAYLVEVFAVEVVAYAVMENHLHTVLRPRPDTVEKYSDFEVAKRWLKIFPPRDSGHENLEIQLQKIITNKERVTLLRKRLSSLSWFNKLLNENIARRANAEDNCTGHFWDGRFYCQKVLDIPGAIACSVYVDLNPIRAKAAKSPENSEFTSIQERINAKKKRSATHVRLVAIEDAFKGKISLTDYLVLVDVTARALKSNKASMPANSLPILERLGITPDSWLSTTKEFGAIFARVIGTKESIQIESAKLQRAIRGIGRAFSTTMR
jgi:REP element-mobilizing transposase RayT